MLWAYDGLADLSFAAGEVKDPQRNLPRAIILGTLALIAHLRADQRRLSLRHPDRRHRDPVAAGRGRHDDGALRPDRRVLVSVFVMISSFSSLNGSMLASPRVFFAMADDGLLFEPIARVHPRFKTPYVAIILAAVLGVALVMSRSFERADRHVRAGDLAVLRAGRRRDLPAAAPRGRICRGRTRRSAIRSCPPIFIASVAAFVINALINEPISTRDHVRADPRRPAGLLDRVSHVADRADANLSRVFFLIAQRGTVTLFSAAVPIR